MSPTHEFTSETARDAFARAGLLDDDEQARPEPTHLATHPEPDDHLCTACSTAGAVVMFVTAEDIEWRHTECLPGRSEQ